MSGGVDSSASAALLKKRGFEVEGVFMRFWKSPGEGHNLCCSAEAEEAARAVAEKLKIPFSVLDLSKEFKKIVVNYFLSEQKKGRTPNPCAVCNKKIKFGLLFEYAKKAKADLLASGHYARVKTIVIPTPQSRGRNLALASLRQWRSGRMGAVKSVAGIRQRSFASLRSAQDDRMLYKIFAAKDKQKDQSYFLWGLDQKKLAKLIFPLAEMEKDEVRRLAKKWRLPFWQTESFDLCFAPEGSESFVKRYLKLKKGPVRDLSGKIMGQHEGLAFYTVGQRKRLDFPLGPWRVVGKDEKKNEIFVSNRAEDLFFKKLIVEKTNWLAGKIPKFPLLAKVKIRFKNEGADARIRKIDGDLFEIVFKKPQFAPTPGQSAVFYSKKGELLGGGVIKKVRN